MKRMIAESKTYRLRIGLAGGLVLTAAFAAVAIAAADPWESVRLDSATAEPAKGAAVVAPAAAAAPPLSPTDQPGVWLGSDGRFWGFDATGGAHWWDGSQWRIWWRPRRGAPAPPPTACPTGRCPYRANS